jgi:hypothetical protein
MALKGWEIREKMEKINIHNANILITKILWKRDGFLEIPFSPAETLL